MQVTFTIQLTWQNICLAMAHTLVEHLQLTERIIPKRWVGRSLAREKWFGHETKLQSYAIGKVKQTCWRSQINTKPRFYMLQTEGLKKRWSQTLQLNTIWECLVLIGQIKCCLTVKVSPKSFVDIKKMPFISQKFTCIMLFICLNAISPKVVRFWLIFALMLQACYNLLVTFVLI